MCFSNLNFYYALFLEVISQPRSQGPFSTSRNRERTLGTRLVVSDQPRFPGSVIYPPQRERGTYSSNRSSKSSSNRKYLLLNR